jgi:hypothetical protein
VTETALGARALTILIAVSAVCGAGAFFAFRRWSDRAAIRRSINLLLARLLEFRLFMDEPRLILRAQGALLVENFRLLRLVLKPVLLLAVPMLIVLSQLEACFEYAPLALGEPALVNVQLNGWSGLPDPPLKAPPGIRFEAGPVRVVAERQISWRLRPVHAAAGDLQLAWNGRVLTKSIVSGAGVHYLSQRRVHSIWSFLLHPTETLLPATDVDWIEVRYPHASIFGMNWLVWFLLSSTAGALLCAAGLKFTRR